MIRQLKYHNNLACARLMGELMANDLINVDPKPKLLIPIPLHHLRYRQRQFNQATEIARPISQCLNIPLNLKACVRTRNTTPQFDLPAKQRKKNLRKAFAMNGPIHADHVAIIDDVVTTATTANEVAKLVRRSGVERIDIWSFARA